MKVFRIQATFQLPDDFDGDQVDALREFMHHVERDDLPPSHETRVDDPSITEEQRAAFTRMLEVSNAANEAWWPLFLESLGHGARASWRWGLHRQAERESGAGDDAPWPPWETYENGAWVEVSAP